MVNIKPPTEPKETYQDGETTTSTSQNQTDEPLPPLPDFPEEVKEQKLTKTDKFFVKKLLKRQEKKFKQLAKKKTTKQNEKLRKKLAIQLIEFHETGFDLIDEKTGKVLTNKDIGQMTIGQLLEYNQEAIKILRTKVNET